MTVERTLPLPATDTRPHRTYRPGDRLSIPVDLPDGTRRLVGDITESNYWIFTIRWTGGEGVARYTHGHEPDGTRFATPADERDGVTRDLRHAAAAEMFRMADNHPRWPAPVLHALRLRAAELTGDTR